MCYALGLQIFELLIAIAVENEVILPATRVMMGDIVAKTIFLLRHWQKVLWIK